MRHEIVVAGGGVAGAAAALALARAGFDVALLEPAPPAPAAAADFDARVYAVAPGAVRFLRSLGAWDRIAQTRAAPYVRMEIWDRDPALALSFDAAECDVPELGFIVEESLLRAALWQKLAGVRHYRTGLAGIAGATGALSLRLAEGEPLEAGLLVGAQGADSPLREWAGIGAAGWSYGQQAVVCHLHSERPHGGAALQRFLPSGPLAFLPLADGRSSIVWSASLPLAGELLALDDAAFCTRAAAALGGRLGALSSPTPRRAFPVRALHAEQFVRPRLALLGDSAHVVHPMAGQGVNLGLGDAEALAQTLAAARAAKRDWSSLRVLKAYERRRRAASLEMLALTESLHRAFGARGGALNVLLNAGLDAVSRAGPLKRQLMRRAMAAG